MRRARTFIGRIQIAGMTLLIMASAALAVGTTEQRINLAEWPKYANGPNIAALPQAQEILSGFEEKTGNRIILRYPGGTAGKKWAEQMRDWFIAYGVPLDYLKLEAGSGAPGQLLLILIRQS